MAWFHLFYSDADLLAASSFALEHEAVKSGQESWRSRLRRIIVFLVLGVIVNGFKTSPAIDMFTYFTNWSLWFIFFSALVGLLLGANPGYSVSSRPHLHALHHVFYTLMLFTQPVVMTVYWGLVHEKHLKDITTEYRSDPLRLDQKVQHAYLVHTLPAFCSLGLMLLNKSVLLKKHSWFLVAFGILYTTSNFVVTKQRGKPLYWFLDWQDYKSVLIAVAINFTFFSLFFLTAALDQAIQGTCQESQSP
mmetsp:Transcript_6537/g.11061  ORF Transcript_6537/g.11061 Transcript_6537/m.11061 type:complete len:248 (-) Transcript_6537:43-786(-)